MLNKNYEYFMEVDLNEYLGDWIAIHNKRIIASGVNIKEVYKKATKKYPSEKILFAKVPEKHTMIFGSA